MKPIDFLMRAKEKVKIFLYKPPTLDWMEERVEDKSVGGYRHLTLNQIQKVVRLVLEEAQKSSSFGFILRDEDLVLEVVFYLVMFNSLGGALQFRKQYSFEEASSFLGETIREIMKTEISYYVETAQKDNRNPNEIVCHLEAVRGRILNNLWNDRLSPYESERNPTPLI